MGRHLGSHLDRILKCRSLNNSLSGNIVSRAMGACDDWRRKSSRNGDALVKSLQLKGDLALGRDTWSPLRQNPR